MTPAQKPRMRTGPRNQVFLQEVADGEMSHEELARWKYRRYMRNYLGTVKAVDESVGRMLKYLDDNDLVKNTIVIYRPTSFFLGEHGYDPR